MKPTHYSTMVFSSFVAFALIVAAVTGIPITSFENVLAQSDNMSTMSQDQSSGSTGSTSFNPEEIIKKEARGLGDADLGEVQEVNGEFIVTQKGTIDKEQYFIPMNLVDHFDGSTVFFTVSEEEAEQYKRD